MILYAVSGLSLQCVHRLHINNVIKNIWTRSEIDRDTINIRDYENCLTRRCPQNSFVNVIMQYAEINVWCRNQRIIAILKILALCPFQNHKKPTITLPEFLLHSEHSEESIEFIVVRILFHLSMNRFSTGYLPLIYNFKGNFLKNFEYSSNIVDFIFHIVFLIMGKTLENNI